MEYQSKWLWMMVSLMIILLGGGSEGCLEEERLALFQLKPFFPFIDSKTIDTVHNSYRRYQYSGFYPEIREIKDGSADCCEWERIECNPTTGRVTHLFLNLTSSALFDDDDDDFTFTGYRMRWRSHEMESWHLNASLFLPFAELRTLSLSGNIIAGFVGNQGFKKLSSKLEILDLSNNNFNDNILPSLSELSRLKSLSLAFNQFTGSNPAAATGIEMLSKKLEVLDLRGNFFNRNIFSSLYALSSLKVLFLDFNNMKGPTHIEDGLSNLEELYVRCFILEGESLTNLDELEIYNSSFPLDFIRTLSSLKKLYVPGCFVNASLFVHGIKMLPKKIEVLDLRGTFFNSSIFSSLSALSNLKALQLTFNNMNGPIHIEDGLSNLEELYMDCVFGGCSLSLQSLGLVPSLKKLYLAGFSFTGTTITSRSQNKWQISASLEELAIYNSSFAPDFIGTLSSLRKLHVFDCFVNGSLFIHEWQISASLEELTIYDSSFAPGFIETLSSLRKLHVSDCFVNDSLFMHGLCGLTDLQELVLINNELKGKLPVCISNFTSLETLDLSINQLSGDVSTFKTLTSLQSLSLSFNQLSGDVSAIKTLTSLESLSLSFNQLSGDVSAIKTLTSLESLSLSFNQLSGDVSALKSLTSLEHLDLSSNRFRIPSSLGPFFNLSKLNTLYVDNNIIYVDQSEMQSNLVPRFQLNVISLSCCGDVGHLPQFLYHQRGLLDVDLSNLKLKGQFPSWLLQNNTSLQSLYLANNSFQGPFELSFLSHTDLSYLDISRNFFNGNVPIKIGAKLPSLLLLNMSKNQFHGSIPASIGDLSSLENLDFSDNQLSGELPEHLAMGCFSLIFLTLSNNRLEGPIFSSNSNLTNLYQLHLDGNHFSGKLPRWMENMSRLSTMDLSNNEMSGEIPRWMGNMSSLQEVMMANNHLEGPFPAEFCRLHLKLLDLSMNNIYGRLPSCFGPPWITEVHLSRNKLEGPLTDVFRNSTFLVTLDLSNNHLIGSIPNWIHNLSLLSYLLLKSNHFEGEIPIQLCNLGHLSLLDLSNNNLSGTIPPCLKITSLNEKPQEYARYVATGAPAPPGTSSFSIDEPVQFTSKNNSYEYKGRVLTYLSGIDLSCNKLTGEIPHNAKNFRNIYALNLSHNRLIGPIPPAFSELKQIESLDLSHNNLSGKIPPQLVGLYSLSFFRVGYNNLSGSTPQWVAQFATFDESSYMGNPFLCGKPLPKNCSTSGPSPSSPPKATTDDGLIDMTAFYPSFVVSYIMVILTIVSVLYINPYWRQAWFYHIGAIGTRCYYFLEDHILPRRFKCGNM